MLNFSSATCRGVFESEQYSGDSAGEIIEKIIAAANLHFGNAPQNDDMTIIIIKRKR